MDTVETVFATIKNKFETRYHEIKSEVDEHFRLHDIDVNSVMFINEITNKINVMVKDIYDEIKNSSLSDDDKKKVSKQFRKYYKEFAEDESDKSRKGGKK